ncbi:NAD(P)/FAD-dependent oxidoreductase [Kribbella sp. NPDC049227]|uniref:NAD(P)/FAD-dependent oxidoreductase n=1 Tax=Kribbella sp. NPDC049227 TaxID=3364113 RepID=UPI00371D9FD6
MANLGSTAPDVVVIGGGIAGIATSLQLQRTGRRVMILERATPGNEASGHNGGMFSGDVVPVGVPEVIKELPHLLFGADATLSIKGRYLPRLAPWLLRFAWCCRSSQVERISTALASITIPGLDAYRPLVAGTGAEEVFGNRGCLFCYIRGASLDPNGYSLQLRKRRGMAYELLDRQGLRRVSPNLDDRFEAGLFFPDSFYTRDPRAFTRTLLADFLAKGGSIEQAEVTSFETTARRVTNVRTRAGQVRAGEVVLAAGPWSRGLLRQLGTRVPLEAERGYGVDIPDPRVEIDLPIVIGDNHTALTPFRTGVRITTIDELASVDAPVDQNLIDQTVRRLKDIYPTINMDGATSWMRSRPSLPDSLPVIGRAPKFDNVFLNFGHGHKGLGIGAFTGKLVTELMTGTPPSVDLHPFRPTRFAFGEKGTSAK